MTRAPIDKVRLAIVGASIVAWLGVLILAASAQEMGQHPPVGQVDPYLHTKSIKSPQRKDGIDCCNGKDCKPYLGPPPQRVQRNGEWGYLFAGKWFFEDWRRIDVRTLHPEVINDPTLCLYNDDYPMCFHWPMNG